VNAPQPATLADTPADLAFRALLDHVVKCSRCAYNWQQCPTRRALATTVREVRNDHG
jgi:hypothetical protein